MIEILLSLSGASVDRLAFNVRPAVQNITSACTDAEDMDEYSTVLQVYWA